MVNVPPIPPLLCSTPPPIDFGEDDEDVDVMRPTLDGVDDDEFCDFLTVDDRKDNEPLPSPRPPSVCDLPPVSIYDGLTSPDEEDVTKQTVSPQSNIDDRIGREIKNNTKTIHITEAFNFNIKNTSDENNKNESVKNADPYFEPQQSLGTNESTEKQNQNDVATKSYSMENSHQESHEKTEDLHTKNYNKNVKVLRIETTSEEFKYESNDSNSNMGCTQNMVSIEDIEDDLSDDELYSPKTSKNFMEADNLNDYFTIQEIEPIKNESLLLETKSFDSLDDNETSSLGNENDNNIKSFSSRSFPTPNFFDMPPPIDKESGSIDEDTDDYGDFADFQDFSTVKTPVNNIVPVTDINNKQHLKNYLEVNESYKINKINIEQNINTTKEDLKSFKDSGECNEYEFDDFTSHITETTEKNEHKRKDIFLEAQNTSQEILNGKFGDCNTAAVKNVKESEPVCNVEESFGDFRADSVRERENIRNDETVTATSENSFKVLQEISNDVDDDFGDFADFESHQEISKPEKNSFTEKDENQSITNQKEREDNEDDEDDFGDFNTAQPITPTASSLSHPKTSQTTTVATPTLSSQNLNERITKILHVMFSPALNNTDGQDIKPKTNKIQEIPFTSIDAAKALEYQWLNSDTRHSFIKSLGIDSRNILFGENWNPCLPRFAANLSFNPLKPMKPAPACGNSAADSCSTLDSTTTNKPLDAAGSTNNNNLEFNPKTFNITEQTNLAQKDNNSATMPYVSSEPPSCAEPASLTIFENSLENDKTFSKTPPISEMESLSTFSSPSPSNAIDIESNNITDFDLNEIEENLDNVLNMNEVVVTSTFTGSFKETHIYTPSKTNDLDTKQTTNPTASTTSSSPSKASPIDFDYEKAAMGVIIDETVVKKEYRDVEYNPPFSMESLSKSVTAKTEINDTNYANNTNVMQDIKDIKMSAGATEDDVNDECSDDFTEFQSVPSEAVLPTATVAAVTNETIVVKAKTTTVAHGGMILSPAILIPQAISMENQKPKIEWGDSTATINPEELARIEELFPEPKSLKSSNTSNSSQKSTPTHQMVSTPSISATVANKELEGSINNAADDDDDWSDFVSVSVINNTSANRSTSNNNILTKSPVGSPFKQRSPVVNHRMPPSNTLHSNSNNDDEWSDFVSSAPPTSQPAPSSYRVPQFNSGAWQNANFYNNPLSLYHKGPLNVSTATKSVYNNNNNYNNISQQPYQIANNVPPVAQQIPNNVYQHQQQIHVMQNFSTAPVPTPERLKNNQFQVGSAKVAPSIALIPDLGFVAPAIPTHTSFINSLPKPSISTKK